MPTKPIRYVVNTHHHFDHSGGLRGYVAEGISILTHEKNKPYFERILRSPFTLEPDRLVRSPRPPVIETVGARRVLRDDSMTMELYSCTEISRRDAARCLPAEATARASAFHRGPGGSARVPAALYREPVENIRSEAGCRRVARAGGIDPPRPS
jgi:hypothetical protein